MGRHSRGRRRAHRCSSEKPCEVCRAADVRVWTAEEFARNRAAVRAMARLAQLHAGLLRTLYLEELRREGLGDGSEEEGDSS